MPLVTIYSVLPKESEMISEMISEVQKLSSKALRCDPSNIWVMFQEVPKGWFVQSPDPQNNPAVVVIKAQEGRSAESKKIFLEVVTEIVGKNLSIPAGRVWAHYQEIRPQDVWFEGHWAV